MSGSRRRAILVLALVAMALGIATTVNALGSPFLAATGQNLAKLATLNTAGGILTIVGGVLALSAFTTSSRGPAAAAGLLFLGMAGLTLVAMNTSLNRLGGRANTLAWFIAFGVGLLALVLSPEAAPDHPASDP